MSHPIHKNSVFKVERSEFMKLLATLSEAERKEAVRSTYTGDCRLPGASELHDEQAWCEAAFAHEGNPSDRTAYVVHVLGSTNYFAYFNFKTAKSDPSEFKCCRSLMDFSRTYVPRMYTELDVERWVFLCPEDIEAFRRAIPEFRRAFELMEYSFESFQSGEKPAVNREQALRSRSVDGGVRSMLASALGMLGIAGEDTWIPREEAIVKKLGQVLSGKPTGPIDQKKAPLPIPKLKALLLKRVRLAPRAASASMRQESIDLYLELARFYPGWDSVSCEGMFESGTVTIDRILNCLTDEKAQGRIDRERKTLVAELAAHGIGGVHT